MENPFSFSYVSKMTEAQRQKAFSFQGMTKKELIAYSKDLGLSGLTKYRHLEIVKRICDAEFKIEGNKSDEINNKIDELILNIFQVKDKLKNVEADVLCVLAINGIIEDMIKKLRDIKGERNKSKGVKL